MRQTADTDLVENKKIFFQVLDAICLFDCSSLITHLNHYPHVYALWTIFPMLLNWGPYFDSHI